MVERKAATGEERPLDRGGGDPRAAEHWDSPDPTLSGASSFSRPIPSFDDGVRYPPFLFIRFVYPSHPDVSRERGDVPCAGRFESVGRRPHRRPHPSPLPRHQTNRPAHSLRHLLMMKEEDCEENKKEKKRRPGRASSPSESFRGIRTGVGAGAAAAVAATAVADILCWCWGRRIWEMGTWFDLLTCIFGFGFTSLQRHWLLNRALISPPRYSYRSCS